MKSRQSGLGIFNFLLILAVVVAVVVLALPHFSEARKGAENTAEKAVSTLNDASEKAKTAVTGEQEKETAKPAEESAQH